MRAVTLLRCAKLLPPDAQVPPSSGHVSGWFRSCRRGSCSQRLAQEVKGPLRHPKRDRDATAVPAPLHLAVRLPLLYASLSQNTSQRPALGPQHRSAWRPLSTRLTPKPPHSNCCPGVKQKPSPPVPQALPVLGRDSELQRS